MEYLLIIGAIFGIGYFLGKSKNKPSDAKLTSHFMKGKTTITHKIDQINVKRNDVENVKLSEEQEKVFNLLEETNSNYYITGKAGTGKSMLLEYFVRKTRKSVAVVAPTGVAALNVGGQTIHSFFKLKPELIEKGDIDRVDYKTKEILTNLDAVVIDEISMVRVDLMEAISEKLKLARRNDLPFGGAQIIMFGDLFQLPPVVSDGQLHRYFDHNYGGIYFFNAPAYKESETKILELNHIFRQKDEEFKELLNAVRNGKHSSEILEKFNERAKVQIPDDGFITLAGRNDTVSRINHTKLANLPDEEKTYIADIRGDLKESAFPTEKNLKLKVGAQIMMLKNDRQKPSRWVNGTLGVITNLNEDTIRVKINGVVHSVSKETWDSVKYYYNSEERKLDKETVSSFTQFPVRLAWAITIHKSQGQTYQSVAIDLSDGAFAHGQTYVALSRCQTLQGLYLNSPINSEDIIVDQDVIEFMKKVEILTRISSK
jgi:hypothetical protein